MVEAGDTVDQTCLAGSIWSYKGNNISRVDFETYVNKGVETMKTKAHAFDF